MDDALTTTADAVETDAVISAIALKCAEHLLSQRIGKGTGLGCGWDDVVHRRNRPLRTSHGQTLVLQGSKGLRTGDLMNQMQPHKQLGGSPGKFGHPMQIPDLVVESA